MCLLPTLGGCGDDNSSSDCSGGDCDGGASGSRAGASGSDDGASGADTEPDGPEGGTGGRGAGGGIGSGGTAGVANEPNMGGSSGGTSSSGGGTAGSSGAPTESGGAAGDSGAGTAGSSGDPAGSGGVAGGGSDVAGGGSDVAGGGGDVAGGGGGGVPGGEGQCNDGIDNDGDGLVDWQYDLGCYNASDPTEAALSRDEDAGFTTFDPSGDSHLVYVSSSEGDDSHDGSSPEQAVQSLARGAELVRDGANDFLLLRRGDVWRGEDLGRFKSGLDAEHPLVVASYGESTERPRVLLGEGYFINHAGGVQNYVALLGLELMAYAKDPEDAEFDGTTSTGLRFVGGGEALLVEDCYLRHAHFIVQSYEGSVYRDTEVRRNVIALNYAVGSCDQNSDFKAQGLYTSDVDGLLIEGNVFDHNGWNEDVEGACATMYNHNMYLGASRLVVRDNLILRASSQGVKMRSDATRHCTELLFENNFVFDGEIGIGFGGNEGVDYRFEDVTVRRNVFSETGRSDPQGRGLAWMLGLQDHDDALVEENYFLHQPWHTNAFGLNIAGNTARNVVVRRNTFHGLQQRSLWVTAADGWESVAITQNTFSAEPGSCMVDHEGGFDAVTYEANRYASEATSEGLCIDGSHQSLSSWESASGETGAETFVAQFAEPERTLGSYASDAGMGDSAESFIAEARTQSRLNWRAELTAPAVNDYIRAGFAEE